MNFAMRSSSKFIGSEKNVQAYPVEDMQKKNPYPVIHLTHFCPPYGLTLVPVWTRKVHCFFL